MYLVLMSETSDRPRARWHIYAWRTILYNTTSKSKKSYKL